MPRSPLFEALRPRQWTKNAFVFAGLLFGGQLFERAAVLRSLLAFAIFCAAASAVYLANDVADRDQDALHPMKRARPIASGRLGTRPAIATAVVAALAAVVGSAALSRPLLWIVLAYLLSSLLYTAGLKRVHVLDVMIVAAGFVLRAAAGAAALPVEISPWLLCCTFLLALYLAIAKRRAELSLLGEEAEQHRPALARYTVPLLDGWLVALTGATIVSYALYTQSQRTVEHFGTTDLLYTLPFVVYALFRYHELVVRRGAGGDPGNVLARDPGLLLALAGWAATAAVIIYRR
ncbi:MAG: decaprenyl-phosphate phosphoribosyltransferase [Deltaproteobacteria bacterium]|nr:MAG: decaprenyl-phosphate phosphoribosyltransferase [Deltaproteobacteria bacterium]